MSDCKNCQRDLSECGPVMDYRLALKCESIPIKGITVDVYMHPPIEGEFYFCGFGCLKQWVNR